VLRYPVPSSMPARTIAIGDVHGCAAALRSILDAIKPQADDTIVVLGDCVDRGPDSRGVIDALLALRERCKLVPLLGNHEEMMLNFLDGRAQPDNWLHCGGTQTMDSYLDADGKPNVPPAHIEYIRTWGDYWEAGNHFFVHGAYSPDLPLSGQRWNVWRWHSLRTSIPEPHISGKIAVVGHSSQKTGEILDVGHLICIDTYCYGGGWLTALEPATGRVWQADRAGPMRD
jgi:serine/threonine protein phosphatase 1